MSEPTTEVGALWSRKGPKGEFWSGTVDIDALAMACVAAGQDPKKVQVVMFRNQYTTTKSGKPAPAFRIRHDTWKPDGQRAWSGPNAPPTNQASPLDSIPEDTF